MFDYKYLSEAHLQGFKKYKYSAVDTSPISNYVMHPSWNFMVKFIPKWIAPNLITFVGFLCLVAMAGLLTVYDYDFNAAVGQPGHHTQHAIPSWVYTTCGVLIFLSYNLDGLDGKQARRIGVSGPLGELFDHGLDSYGVFLIPFSIISIFGRDPVYSVSCFRGFLMTVSVVLNFYASHCEKYSTGTLYLPWGYDVSMWVTSLAFIVAGVYGPDAYKFYVFGDTTFGVLFETIAHLVGFLGTAPIAVYNVYLYRKNLTGKLSPLWETIRPLWSMLLVLIVTITWAVQSTNQIIDYDPRAFIFMFGTLFSNVASRLIIAEITHQRCEVVNPLFWPLAAGVATSLYHPHLEIPILYCLLLIIILAHIHYGTCVVRQICVHFKIPSFTVPVDKWK